MAYRTYVNGTQIFGNNEYYKDWIDFLKSKGIDIDEEGIYEGEIDDVMGIFSVIDKITRELINKRHEEVKKGQVNFDGKPLREMTDLSDSMWLRDDTPILMFNEQMVEHAYCFLPYQVYMAIQDKIERTDYILDKNGIDWSFCTYKIKDGEKIKVSAY